MQINKYSSRNLGALDLIERRELYKGKIKSSALKTKMLEFHKINIFIFFFTSLHIVHMSTKYY